MNLKSSPKGSEWRRWDLHIHPPGTKLSDGYGDKSEDWDRYIDFLESSPVAAFGVTDYFSADGYRSLLNKYKSKYPKTEKVFFLNIELRLAEAISKKSTNPHIHIIFDNNALSCPDSKIGSFLSALKTLAEDESGVKKSCAELSTPADFASASVTIDGIKSALNDTFGDSKPYLIAFPAKNDGVRSTDSSSPRKVLINDKIDRMTDLFLGDAGSKGYFLRNDRYEIGCSKPKPVVSGSDAHSFEELERLDGNVSGFEPTWIKCDLTFRGLQQICFEPDSRIFIGAEPAVESRKLNQATKFISKIEVNKVAGYDGSNGTWFDRVEIPLNPELTVIIGNKGSGKSALVDIMGLAGESRQEEHFSFLSDKGTNKKFKQRGYAENFNAKLTWQSSFVLEKNLNGKVDKAKPELVRYLPQNYFEQLTNEIEIEEFRNEIEDVVFSHVEESDRMGLSSFSELEEFKTKRSRQETIGLKSRLEDLNIEIVELEGKASPLYKKQLEEELKVKKAELSSLQKARPVEVNKPDQESVEQKALSEEIDRLGKKRDEIGAAGKLKTEILSQNKNRLQKLDTFLKSINSLENYFGIQKENLNEICIELGLNIDGVIRLVVETGAIQDLIKVTTETIEELEADNGLKLIEGFYVEALYSLPDLREAYRYVSDQLEDLKKRQGTPQRKYQAYIEKLISWERQQASLIGDEEDPKVGTIRYIEEKIKYIDDELAYVIEALALDRKQLVSEIFHSKMQILSFYSDLKASVEARLGAVRTADFAVDIDASFVLYRFFIRDFLGHIMKNRRGSFHGANNPEKLMSDLVAEVDWNSFDSIWNFFEVVNGLLITYDGASLSLQDQVTNVCEFYNYLFSLEYLSSRYELRLGGKNLNELSPGEKGLLLLVFYLQLDKDNIPLIIDQPEDNLDNESIFAVLANCIRDAKQNRQVILVTHNPNLAVGADAEQIIYVKLEKSSNYKFSFESGSIENPRINQKIVDILEGTQPAFVKRRLKYHI